MYRATIQTFWVIFDCPDYAVEHFLTFNVKFDQSFDILSNWNKYGTSSTSFFDVEGSFF